METPLLAQHRAAGAGLAEYSGCLLPARFSTFRREYEAARDAVAAFDTTWHAVIVPSGPDRARYLNAVLTNNIQALTAGRGCIALLLNPQGHILAEVEVYAEPDRLLTLSHASVRERTVATLDKYIIMDDVQLEDLTDGLGSFAVEGPRAPAIIQQACGIAIEELPDMSIREVTIEHVSCTILRRSHFGELGAEFIAPAPKLTLLWPKLAAAAKAHGGAPIGTDALNALRLEARVPWFPVDFNDTVIPHEAAVENTHISFTKGCYTGQEIVERVRSRGQVHRKRVLLKFSDGASTVPRPGTKLSAGDGTEVGAVTSAAYSPASRASIGMGYVRGESNAPGSALKYEGGTATVMP